MQHPAELPPLAGFLSGIELPPWTAGTHQSRAGSTPERPSFAASLDRAIRMDHVVSAQGQEPLAWRLRRREWLAGWLAAHGYRHARILAGRFPLAALPDHLGDLERFVIKPTDAHSSLGVMALLRDGPGYSYLSVESGRRHDIVELMELLAAPMEAFGFTDSWQIEELLLPPGGAPGVLCDFKFYAFHGQIPLVLQAIGRHELRRYRWLDSNWMPVRTGKYDTSLDDAMPVPKAAEALMETARTLSKQLPLPFCRIDLYETAEGVAVGELTPEPGEYHAFSEGVDRYLGLCFERAEADLLLRAHQEAMPA